MLAPHVGLMDTVVNLTNLDPVARAAQVLSFNNTICAGIVLLSCDKTICAGIVLRRW
jgi:hypothetical protein